MTPGITASQMPPWPDERLGLNPRADCIVAANSQGPSLKKSENKNLHVHKQHHMYHPLPLSDQVPPLKPATAFYLPDTRDAHRVDMRGYHCYKRNLEAIQRREQEMNKTDVACGCIFGDRGDDESTEGEA